jgi:hypothetical protein
MSIEVTVIGRNFGYIEVALHTGYFFRRGRNILSNGGRCFLTGLVVDVMCTSHGHRKRILNTRIGPGGGGWRCMMFI